MSIVTNIFPFWFIYIYNAVLASIMECITDMYQSGINQRKLNYVEYSLSFPASHPIGIGIS